MSERAGTRHVMDSFVADFQTPDSISRLPVCSFFSFSFSPFSFVRVCVPVPLLTFRFRLWFFNRKSLNDDCDSDDRRVREVPAGHNSTATKIQHVVRTDLHFSPSHSWSFFFPYHPFTFHRCFLLTERNVTWIIVNNSLDPIIGRSTTIKTCCTCKSKMLGQLPMLVQCL